MTTVKEMVERLGLSPRLAKQVGLRRVTDSEARAILHIGTSARSGKDRADYGGIAFPGHDLRGVKRGVYQIRRDAPDIVNGKEKSKWMSPSGSDNRYLNTTPGALRPRDLGLVVESPKSVWAIAASAELAGRKHIKVISLPGLREVPPMLRSLGFDEAAVVELIRMLTPASRSNTSDSTLVRIWMRST